MSVLVIGLILTALFLLYLRGCFLENRYLEQIIYIEAYLATYNYAIRSYQENEENFWFVVEKFEEIIRFDLDKKRTKRIWAKFAYIFSHHWQNLLITKAVERFERFKNIQNKIA